MRLKNYIYPKLVFKSFTQALKERQYFTKYAGILNDLEQEGKLEKMGFRKEGSMLYIGVNLNPELLMYTDDSHESVELKFVSEAMKKYTDFLQNEGILDSIVADYERVFNEEFYGYVVQIRYKFKNYRKKRMIYDICYLSSAFILSIAAAAFGLSFIL